MKRTKLKSFSFCFPQKLYICTKVNKVKMRSNLFDNIFADDVELNKDKNYKEYNGPMGDDDIWNGTLKDSWIKYNYRDALNTLEAVVGRPGDIEWKPTWHLGTDVDDLPRSSSESTVSKDVLVHIPDGTEEGMYVNDHYNFVTGEWSLGIGQPDLWTELPKLPSEEERASLYSL